MRPLLIFVALAAGCSSEAISLPGDGGADLSVGDLGDCPNYNPSSGAGAGGACASLGETCRYFEAYCHCNDQDRTWHCCTNGVPLPCPTPTPSTGDSCCLYYMSPSCSYACVGGVATVCTCSDDFWHCTTVPCD